MDPRLKVELERERREARERKLRLVQVALQRTPGGGPVGWTRRFEKQARATDISRTVGPGRRKASP